MSADTKRVAVVEREDGLYHEVARTFLVDRESKKV
jgi:hypothetical protein